MTDQLKTIVRTAAEFDALPDDSLAIAIAIDPGIAHWRRPSLRRKFGRKLVNLDPADRDNGERTQPGGYLANLLTGFGRRDITPGLALVLGEGETVDSTSLEQLDRGAVISVNSIGQPIYFTHDSHGLLPKCLRSD